MSQDATPARVAFLREWLGPRTQEEGATLIGVSQQTLSKLLAGANAGLETRVKLKRAAGLPLAMWPADPLGVTDSELEASP